MNSSKVSFACGSCPLKAILLVLKEAALVVLEVQPRTEDLDGSWRMAGLRRAGDRARTATRKRDAEDICTVCVERRALW